MRALLISVLIFAATTLLHAQILANGGFENGRNGWTVYASLGDNLIGTGQQFTSSDITPTVYPRSGNMMVRLGGFNYDDTYISQTVTLPNTTPLYFVGFYQDRTWNGSECAGLWVGAEVTVTIAGQTLTDEYLCTYNEVHQWTPWTYNISSAAGRTIEIKIRGQAANSVWSFIYFDDMAITNSASDVEEVMGLTPMAFRLGRPSPNPARSGVEIPFTLGSSAAVALTMHAADGRTLATLTQGTVASGEHHVRWNGDGFPAGIYFCRLTVDGRSSMQRVVLVK
jgi:hypothetical protein